MAIELILSFCIWKRPNRYTAGTVLQPRTIPAGRSFWSNKRRAILACRGKTHHAALPGGTESKETKSFVKHREPTCWTISITIEAGCRFTSACWKCPSLWCTDRPRMESHLH